jgi:CheY-like chemotaxis protein
VCSLFLLLDLWMPGMDGWQVRRKLEEDDQLCKIPVVVMTATEPPSATTMNVRAVISKPSPLYDILLVVSKHC